MAKVLFSFNGKEITIQCSKEEKMKDICNRFATKININFNSLLFLYGGNKINFELTYRQSANSIDNNYNQMNILVYKNESEGLKCKHCGNIIYLPLFDNIIKYNNEQKDTLIEIKNQINNIIILNDIHDIIRKIKIVKMIIDNLISENEKSLKETQNISSNIKKYNNFYFESIKNYGFTSNEENKIVNIITNSVKQNSDWTQIVKNIWKECSNFKEGKWTVSIGDRDKLKGHTNEDTYFIAGNIGPYKIIIVYDH